MFQARDDPRAQAALAVWGSPAYTQIPAEEASMVSKIRIGWDWRKTAGPISARLHDSKKARGAWLTADPAKKGELLAFNVLAFMDDPVEGVGTCQLFRPQLG